MVLANSVVKGILREAFFPHSIRSRIFHYVNDLDRLESLETRFGEMGVCSQILQYEQSLLDTDACARIITSKTVKRTVKEAFHRPFSPAVQATAIYWFRTHMEKVTDQMTRKVIVEQVLAAIREHSEEPRILVGALPVLERLLLHPTEDAWDETAPSLTESGLWRIMTTIKKNADALSHNFSSTILPLTGKIESLRSGIERLEARVSRLCGQNHRLLSICTLLSVLAYCIVLLNRYASSAFSATRKSMSIAGSDSGTFKLAVPVFLRVTQMFQEKAIFLSDVSESLASCLESFIASARSALEHPESPRGIQFWRAIAARPFVLDPKSPKGIEFWRAISERPLAIDFQDLLHHIRSLLD